MKSNEPNRAPGSSREFWCSTETLVKLKKLLKKLPKVIGTCPWLAQINGALEAEFQVSRRLEVDLLSMDPGRVVEGVPLQAANQKIVTDRADDFGENRNSRSGSTRLMRKE